MKDPRGCTSVVYMWGNQMLPDSHLYHSKTLCKKKPYLKQDKQMCDPLPPKQILLIVSVHVNEVLYRSQIFIEKSKTLNYFFNIYDTLVYCDLAAFIYVSALVLVSLPAYYDTWSSFIVWGRISLPCRRRSN